MTMTTDRLGLPLIASGQAQKEMTHNEALAALDIAVQPIVEAIGVDTPPVSPLAGQCRIVGDAPTGLVRTGRRAGRLDAVGLAISDASRRVDRRGGGQRLTVRHDGSGWIAGVLAAVWVEIGGIQVLSERAGGDRPPDGGTIIVVEVRQALTHVINALRAHGLITI